MSLPAQSRPRLRLVFDPEDHVDHHQALLAVHNLSHGRVVGQLKPGRQAPALLASAVLEGLGKELDRRGNPKSDALNWRRSALWLRAEGVDELILMRAQHLDWRGYGRVVSLAAQADCGLTLVVSGCTELDARREQAIADFPFQRLEFADWQTRYGAHWISEPCGEADAPADRSFPPVPADDFAVFRAVCKRCLAEADFAIVDACWRAAYLAADEWTTTAAVSENAVAEFLREQMRTARSYGEVLTKLRAAQAALFRRAWLVKVNHELFAASALQEPYDLLTPATARLLRGFVAPRFAAAATLALATREPTEVLTKLRLCDIAEDGSSVRIRGKQLLMPSAFTPFIRAQRLERAAGGACDENALFVSERARHYGQQSPMNATSFSATLRLVARETGVLVTRDFTRRKVHANAINWADRRGVSVAALPREIVRTRWREAA